MFGRAFTKDLIKETKLYLPIDDNQKPDYKFMEEYIKSLAFSKKIDSKAVTAAPEGTADGPQI